MPEPLLYLKAMGAATTISAIFVLAMAGLRRPPSLTRLNSACVLGTGLGFALGYKTLDFQFAWPPANGLDRFLTVVVPAVLFIELIAGFPCVPRWFTWFLRIGLAATIPRILLHGSVYLSGSDNSWTLWQEVMAYGVCGGLLSCLWLLLSWLSERSTGVSIPFALCLTIQCSGLTVMMAGYIKGGAVVFPLVAALVATTIGARLIAKPCAAQTNCAPPAILGIAVVSFFGLLFIGRFFGRLSTGGALVMLLAPLLCWATEAPLLRHRKPWLVGSIRLMLVALLLGVVLVGAKRDFDRNIGPLLEQGTGMHFFNLNLASAHLMPRTMLARVSFDLAAGESTAR